MKPKRLKQIFEVVAVKLDSGEVLKIVALEIKRSLYARYGR